MNIAFAVILDLALPGGYERETVVVPSNDVDRLNAITIQFVEVIAAKPAVSIELMLKVTPPEVPMESALFDSKVPACICLM